MKMKKGYYWISYKGAEPEIAKLGDEDSFSPKALSWWRFEWGYDFPMGEDVKVLSKRIKL